MPPIFCWRTFAAARPPTAAALEVPGVPIVPLVSVLSSYKSAAEKQYLNHPAELAE
jgi:hypothetical protein